MSIFRSDRPNVVATVTQEADLAFLSGAKVSDLPDLLEFRLDNLANHLNDSKRVIEAIRGTGPGTLLTARHSAEGGMNNLSTAARAESYRRFMDLSDLIDTEVRSMGEGAISEVVSEAREKSVDVVASFHDFEKFPGKAKLIETVESAYAQGASIAKLAVYVATFSELNDLVELVENQRSKGLAISAMGMGPLGKLSRLVLAKAGSCLNYGYLQKENAPGQWPALALKNLVAEI